MSHIPASVRLGKRSLDLVAASAGLILLSPFLPLIALLIKLDSPGPVLFRQMRIGAAYSDRTELFNMIKFRSMCQHAERNGAQWASRNDSRVTRVGGFLRKTRLDEIPQLWNVIRGDMSLIGPRPERPGFYQRLEQEIPFFAERTFGMRPGVTGLAQVRQGYDESIDDVRSKVGYDHAYGLAISRLRGWLRTDLEIIWRTIGVMVGKRGQ